MSSIRLKKPVYIEKSTDNLFFESIPVLREIEYGISYLFDGFKEYVGYPVMNFLGFSGWDYSKVGINSYLKALEKKKDVEKLINKVVNSTGKPAKEDSVKPDNSSDASVSNPNNKALNKDEQEPELEYFQNLEAKDKSDQKPNEQSSDKPDEISISEAEKTLAKEAAESAGKNSSKTHQKNLEDSSQVKTDQTNKSNPKKTREIMVSGNKEANSKANFFQTKGTTELLPTNLLEAKYYNYTKKNTTSDSFKQNALISIINHIKASNDDFVDPFELSDAEFKVYYQTIKDISSGKLKPDNKLHTDDLEALNSLSNDFSDRSTFEYCKTFTAEQKTTFNNVLIKAVSGDKDVLEELNEKQFFTLKYNYEGYRKLVRTVQTMTEKQNEWQRTHRPLDEAFTKQLKLYGHNESLISGAFYDSIDLVDFHNKIDKIKLKTSKDF